MNPLDSSELIKARDLLANGDVVAIPTETVYGLAADIASEPGLRKVFALKERPFFDPLIVHVASFKQAAEQTTDWTPLTDYIARVFWPGPLTIVLKKAEHINPLITSGLDTVAVRYPAHPVAQDLIELLGSPLAAPSANKFGHTSPSTAAHVREEFKGQELFIIDAGPCDVGIESTVIAIDETTSPSTVRILRPGAISSEMLVETLQKWSKPTEVKFASIGKNTSSPGHLEHHYMPKIPLIICPSTPPHELSAEERLKIRSSLGQDIKNPIELVLDEDPTIAARELYGEMRRISDSGADAIFVRQSEQREGLWRAIWDRLERAAKIQL